MLLGKARLHPERGGRVAARTSLLYLGGADPTIDRPTHVRAGSALVSLSDDHLAVIQDDACFLAIIDTKTKTVRDVPFPMPTPTRQFDDLRGNKKLKLDLEAAFLTPDARLLVALGSGSSPLRERIVLIENPSSSSPNVSILEAPELYAMFRAEPSFAGSELNVEGATISGESLVFFQRGNGAPAADIKPVDATARVALAPFLSYLRKQGPCPPLERVIGWELGEAAPGKGRLTFTDGAAHGDGSLAFLACAEDSPDAVTDGPVTAVAIGVIDEERACADLGLLLDERGEPLLDKAEGLAFDPQDPSRAFVVTDRDDPDAPSQLLEIRLGDAWVTGAGALR